MKYFVWNKDGMFLGIVVTEGFAAQDIMTYVRKKFGVGCMFQAESNYCAQRAINSVNIDYNNVRFGHVIRHIQHQGRAHIQYAEDYDKLFRSDRMAVIGY